MRTTRALGSFCFLFEEVEKDFRCVPGERRGQPLLAVFVADDSHPRVVGRAGILLPSQRVIAVTERTALQAVEMITGPIEIRIGKVAGILAFHVRIPVVHPEQGRVGAVNSGHNVTIRQSQCPQPILRPLGLVGGMERKIRPAFKVLATGVVHFKTGQFLKHLLH